MSIQKKVLIVDDDKTFRMSLGTVFAATGFEVKEAEDGQQGLAIAKDTKPTVIILDVRMPIMDGITMLKELKKDPILSSIPVFMLTNVQEEIANTVKYGAQEALVKSSVVPKQLANSISEFLRVQ